MAHHVARREVVADPDFALGTDGSTAANPAGVTPNYLSEVAAHFACGTGVALDVVVFDLGTPRSHNFAGSICACPAEDVFPQWAIGTMTKFARRSQFVGPGLGLRRELAVPFKVGRLELGTPLVVDCEHLLALGVAHAGPALSGWGGAGRRGKDNSEQQTEGEGAQQPRIASPTEP